MLVPGCSREVGLNCLSTKFLTLSLRHISAKPTRPHEFFALSDVFGETTRGGKSVEVTSRHLKVWEREMDYFTEDRELMSFNCFTICDPYICFLTCRT